MRQGRGRLPAVGRAMPWRAIAWRFAAGAVASPSPAAIAPASNPWSPTSFRGRPGLCTTPDARRPDQVAAVFAAVEADLGPPWLRSCSTSAAISAFLVDTTDQKYFKAWEQCAQAGFLVGREAAWRMPPRQRGASSDRRHRQPARRFRLCRLRRGKHATRPG